MKICSADTEVKLLSLLPRKFIFRKARVPFSDKIAELVVMSMFLLSNRVFTKYQLLQDYKKCIFLIRAMWSSMPKFTEIRI